MLSRNIKHFNSNNLLKLFRVVKKILITGASGFIGRVLTKNLCEKNYIVHATVNNNFLYLESMANYIRSEKLRLFRSININNKTCWDEALKGVEVIIHLAGKAHILSKKHSNNYDEFYDVNVLGTEHLARMAASQGVKRFIFMSSIGVNGQETTYQPFNELLQPAPVADYAISKWEAEKRLKKIADESTMDVVILRPTLVYGADAPGNFGRLLHLVAKGIPLPLASIDNKRSFLSRDNLLDFIITCINHPKAGNETFIVSDGEDISTPVLIRYLAAGMGKSAYLWPVSVSLLKFGAYLLNRSSMCQQLCGSLQVDISKAKKLLNWIPPVSIDEGLRETAQLFLELQKNK